MNISIQESKGACQRCGEHIAFPTNMDGASVTCPHCLQETALREDSKCCNKTPVRTTTSNLLMLLILGAAVFGFAILFAVFAIKSSVDKRRIADERESQIQDAEKHLMQPLAALKVKTEGCTIDELEQCETDLKTTYEIYGPQLVLLSDDIDKLIRTLDACQIIWKNSNLNSIENGVIYPAWTGQLDAMAVIDPNITNVVNAPGYKPRAFSGKKFISLALREINLQSDIILNEIRLQTIPK